MVLSAPISEGDDETIADIAFQIGLIGHAGILPSTSGGGKRRERGPDFGLAWEQARFWSLLG